MGEAKRFIRAVHLNSSISGARVGQEAYDATADYITRLKSAMRHVGKMDPHMPFQDREISRVLDSVQPRYLVYELAAKNLQELQDAVDIQNDVLKE